MKYVEKEIERVGFAPKTCTWTSPLGDKYFLKIPNTVYPPREDTNLLAKTLMNFNSGDGKKLLEIGCGINPHSLRMYNNIPMSKEYKLPKVNKSIHIRLNPEEEEKTKSDVLHLNMGAKSGFATIQIVLQPAKAHSKTDFCMAVNPSSTCSKTGEIGFRCSV